MTSRRPSPRATYCVGEGHVGGIVAFGAPAFRSGLAQRAGYVDVALTAKGVYVADALDRAVVWLDLETGKQLGRLGLRFRPHRVGPAGDDIWVLGAAPATLGRVRLAPSGAPMSVASTPLIAPARDAVWHPATSSLWTVGPQQAPVRRDRGPIRFLRSHLGSYDLAADPPTRQRSVDLGALGHVDGTALCADRDGLWVVATGSDTLWHTCAGACAEPDDQRSTGFAPAAVARLDPTHVAVANRLSDSVSVFRAAALEPVATIELDRFWRVTADIDEGSELGERLFYSAALWDAEAGDAYSCNSCHWDTRVDHRVHPGYLERRHEATRPLGGVIGAGPIFSTLGADTLVDAIEGLLRGLDARFWKDGGQHGSWWTEDRLLRDSAGVQRRIKAKTVRRALLEFVANLPVRRGPLRRPGAALGVGARRGWDLFQRDCLGCHQATPDARRPQQVPPNDVPRYLGERPLLFGRAAWALTGAEPYFTPWGNRISPLLDLGRGGPFFANGSAATLREVIAHFRPGDARVHRGAGRHGAGYTPDERDALHDFLLSL